MKRSVPHDLGLDLARRAVVAAFDAYGARFARYAPQADWAGDVARISFRAKGITLRGSVEVREQSLELTLDVPFLLRPFEGRAVPLVEREIADWLERARRGALPPDGAVTPGRDP